MNLTSEIIAAIHFAEEQDFSGFSSRNILSSVPRSCLAALKVSSLAPAHCFPSAPSPALAAAVQTLGQLWHVLCALSETRSRRVPRGVRGQRRQLSLRYFILIPWWVGYSVLGYLESMGVSPGWAVPACRLCCPSWGGRGVLAPFWQWKGAKLSVLQPGHPSLPSGHSCSLGILSDLCHFSCKGWSTGHCRLVSLRAC